jgi:hypothetical protein
MSPPDPNWQRVIQNLRILEEQRGTLRQAQDFAVFGRFPAGEGIPTYPSFKAEVDQVLRAASAGNPSITEIAAAQAGLKGDTFNQESINAFIGNIDKQVDAAKDELYAIDAQTAYGLYPDIDKMKKAVSLAKSFGEGGSAGPSYSFQIGQRGEVIRMSSAGGFEIIGTYPELANKTTQVINDTTTGHAYAMVLDVDGNVTARTDLGKVAHAEIDPERKFRLDILTSAASVEQSMAGIELQRRGQVVGALGDDFARQVQLGQLSLQEAQLNLNRIDSALEQRRAERQQLLQYGVTEASLRTNARGERVTQLPFGSQLASILSATTGRAFSEEDFQLGTGVINPDQAARDVMAGSAYTSSIPGLTQQAASTSSLINAIVGAPLPATPASAAVQQAAAAVPGV